MENNIRPFRTYDIKEIQKVYHQHAYHCGTVLYSTDKGYTWQSVGMDSGKWDILNWLFAFISIK
jgi:hypothetical protein